MPAELSVIIPTFQRAERLAKLLKSLDRSRASFEVIVVDDGSEHPLTNTSQFTFPLEIARQANRGPGVARNTGAGLARTDLLLFLDDDCEVEPGALEACLAVFHENPSVLVLGAQLERLGEDRTLKRVPFLSTAALAIRKSTFLEIGGFDPAFLTCEDDDLCHRLRQKQISLWRHSEFRVLHTPSQKRWRGFRRLLAYSGESEDILIRKHGWQISESFPRQKFYQIRGEFLRRPGLLSWCKLSLLSALWLFLWGTVSVGRAFCRFQCKRLIVWFAGVFVAGAVLLRYLSQVLQQASSRLGLFLNVFRYAWPGIAARNRFIVFVTGRCQADCEHCFYFEHLNTGQSEMTLENYDQLSCEAGPIFRMNVCGGEPFLRKDLVDIIQLFYRRNSLREVSLPTNGFSSGTAATLKELLRRCPRLQVMCSVSLDGPEKIHDELRRLKGLYARALLTLRALLDLKKEEPRLRVGVNATLIARNQNVLAEYLEELRRLFPLLNYVNGDFAYRRFEGGLSKNREKELVFTETEWREKLFALQGREASGLNQWLTYTLGRVNRQAEQTGRQPVPCVAARRFAVIRENGDVAYCEEREAIGNLHRDSYHKILTSPKALAVRGSIERGECACSNCIFQSASLWASLFTRSGLLFLLHSLLGWFRFRSPALQKIGDES